MIAALGLNLTQMYGPAVCCKRKTSERRRWVLHQCIRPICGAFQQLLATMDMSAHSISLAGKASMGYLGHQFSIAPGRPVLHRVVHALADLGGKRG